MVALKSNEAERFLNGKNWDIPSILIYGPDTGLVSERAKGVVNAVSGGIDDPFMQVRIDCSELVKDKSRLVDEVLTIPLLEGKRIIWVKDGNNSITQEVKTAIEANNNQALVVIEAGELRKDSSLRKLIEKHKTAVAVPCYPDTAKDLDRLIDEEIKKAGLSISREARSSLQSLLGADRLASRGELGKLCLYAHGKGQIEVMDVEAVVGDASELALDSLIDSVTLGKIDEFNKDFERLRASGMNASVIAGSVQRHFQWLLGARSEFDKGKRTDQIVGSAIPPIYFQRRPLVSRQISLWKEEQLSKATAFVGRCILNTRKLPAHMGYAIVSDALTTLARIAARNNRNRM